eukprot:CAMPEP_0113411114 /NCGR_PEP_ID=MMETSP0013_2-20120614/22071_1 /TAXON_ID=2843 ORGANISM="Skeletonema costatum, Strain 1716" /NCGR_SAMPLE_ID=MMETSP0013_2 /ASSEMBLY_ACC=CAM_ASM_000158 /LENGTH=750 /DNA_ID=CAMNT_0000297403 /DNA_START=53 /DNA_END=2302 /DNA_ORIENTATION=- /assembly_acc=CAM_ASM_000158
MSTQAEATKNDVISPPVARRDEEKVCFAGVGPADWDAKMPRQSNDSSEKLLDPPVAIPDPYGWLRDDTRENKEILDYLRAENEYSQSMTTHLKGLQDSLYDEFLSSIQETDYTTPRSREGFWYYTRTFKGESYSAYCRAPKTSDTFSINWDGTKESPIMPGEEVYLNVNELAKDKSYCSVGRVKPSPSQTYIAYAVDFSGDEKYEMHVRNLETGEDVALTEVASDDLLEVDGLLWGKDDDTLYYMTMDEFHRPYRLYQRKDWKSDAPTDTLLKEELDDLFWCSSYKSLDGKYIFFDTASKETSEVWYLSTEDESSVTEMKCVAKRRNKVLYEVEHGDDSWYVWTNVDGSPNMKLMSSPATADSAANWELVVDANGTPLFDGSLAKSLDSVTVLNTHVVIEGREGGIPRVWVYSKETKKMKMLSFDEDAYDVGMLAHFEADTKSIAVSYDSLVTPPSSIEISLDDDSQRTVLKTKAVPGYDKGSYGCDRMEVLSRDGETKVPISVVYSNETMEKVKAGERVPVHLYGYGSYGACMEADFDTTRLPLIKRGMIYVIAHIRGGGEMGRQWYEEPNGAKYLCKKNTFNDFVDVAKFLVDTWTTPEMLSCEGRSAGGLLIGASINQAPELFKCAILGVPFVDVAVTMTDSTIPLTSGEWVEWGNPNEEKYHQYMMEYSPMNNVQKGKTYPACWLTGGLNDPRVAYWEPAKMTATLRHANPDNENPICMKLDLSAGHFSASDRYKYFRELAYDYSF